MNDESPLNRRRQHVGRMETGTVDKAVRLARDHFDTGMVHINSFGVADPNMPFGGAKDSGFGREHGGFRMKESVNANAIFFSTVGNLEKHRKPSFRRKRGSIFVQH